MVSEGKARIFRRTDGKYLIYVPVTWTGDSMFPLTPKEKGIRQTEASEAKSLNIQGICNLKTREKKLVFKPIDDLKRKTIKGDFLCAPCRIFVRSDGKTLIYLSKAWAEDTMFPFPLTKEDPSKFLKATFQPHGPKQIEFVEWQEPVEMKPD